MRANSLSTALEAVGWKQTPSLKKDMRASEYPVHLIFGKSLVGGSPTRDIFEKIPDELYPVRAGETYPAQAKIRAPADGPHPWQIVEFKAEAGGREAGGLEMRLHIGKGSALPR